MEIRLENFKGIKRSSIRRELEIPDPSFLREAKNIVIANDGSIHCHSGNIQRTPASTGIIHRIFYSKALDKYVTLNAYNGDLKVLSVSYDGVWAIDYTHSGSALLEGTDPVIGYGTQLVDWPLTNSAYLISPGGGGNNIYKLHNNGASLTAVSLTFSPNVICVHKDTLWLADGSTLYPSNNLDPETFDTNNSINIAKGSLYITCLLSCGGVLYAHKPDNISGVFGDNFAGAVTSIDTQIIDLDTGVGAMRPSAGCVYKGLMWFVGPGGMYVCNGEKVKPLLDRLNFQFMRKSVV